MGLPEMNLPLICIRCRGPLEFQSDRLRCSHGHEWPVEEGIADFAEGRYYDSFDDSTDLRAGHAEGLALEIEGTRRRVLDYYAPMIPVSTTRPVRVLDCGCGNGVSVDLLCDAGMEAWGNDLSALRKWQWRERKRRDRLVVASAMTLPFSDGYFDVIISSGVIEHLGVEETAVPRYMVRPLPDRQAVRDAFFRELSRVLAPGGQLFIDCPNRLFPIDFWHADAPGRPRFHSPREPFLPSFGEIEAHAAAAFPGARIEALSPYRRLQFHQSSRHWWGRLFARPADLFLKLMSHRPFRFLASGWLNPFLVVRITKAA
jgi:SAM-dependent methyltransferase